MYPEGTRHRARGLLPFLPGAAWIALMEGAPIVPVGIRGTGRIWPGGSRWPRRVPIRITFAEPIEVDREPEPRVRREKAAKLSEELRGRIERLVS